MLTRDQILGARDLPTKVVPVPEWKGDVTIRTLSAAEAKEWSERSSVPDLSVHARGLITMSVMVALSVVDAAGNRVFTDEDLEELQKKNPAAIRRIFDDCLKLNAATAEEVKALEKN